MSKFCARLNVALARHPALRASNRGVAFLRQLGLTSKLPDIQNLHRVLKNRALATQISVGLLEDAKIKTGIVSRDDIHAMSEEVGPHNADNLSPRGEANLAILEHSSVVGEMLARIKRAHHFLGIGEVFLHQPITLKRNFAALVMNAITDVVNVTLKANGLPCYDAISINEQLGA